MVAPLSPAPSSKVAQHLLYPELSKTTERAGTVAQLVDHCVPEALGSSPAPRKTRYDALVIHHLGKGGTRIRRSRSSSYTAYLRSAWAT